MFAINGTSTYPDATFTLRLSFGSVKGYRQDGRDIAPITTLGGAFERATGADPFRLPDSWIAARRRPRPGGSRSISPPPTTSSAAIPARR